MNTDHHAQGRLLGSGQPGADGAEALCERAMAATDVAMTISDARRPDTPLIWANPAFSRTTGYALEEVVGHNCRFLQGPDTDEEPVQRLRAAVAAGRSVTVTLLNYRKDGTTFWNELSLSPMFDDAGRVSHFVGVQADVTARVRGEHERERALRAERAARTEAEAARETLGLLAEVTTLLSATLDVDTAMQRLAGFSVPAFADWCAIDVVDPSADGPAARRVAVSHADSRGREALAQGVASEPSRRTGAVGETIVDGEPRLLAELDDGRLAGLVAPAPRDVVSEVGGHAAMVVPLVARRSLLGVMTLVAIDPERELDPSDLRVARDLASRAALAIDNARLYTREHEVAETLQRSLLPDVPTDAIEGLEVCARYQPSRHDMEIGGDWFDVLRLSDDTAVFSIGDVMGHDPRAASAMGQIRSVVRAYAWERSQPGELLDRVDQLVQGLGIAQLATAWFGRVERAGGDGPFRVRFANAGHLPPMLRTPDGEVRELAEASSLLLGAWPDQQREEAEVDLVRGSLLLLYTDGLLERPGASLDQGLAWLRAQVANQPLGCSAEAMIDGVLQAVETDELVDDVAMLAVRVR